MTDTLIYPVGAARFFFGGTTLTPSSAGETAAPEWDFAAVYGAGSELAERGSTSIERGVAFVGQGGGAFTAYDAVFQLVIFVVMGVYCVMVYHFREQIAMALKSASSLKSEERPGDENKYFADRFLILAMVLGCVVAGIFVVNVGRGSVAGNDLWPLVFLPVAVVVPAVFMTKFAMLKIAGKITFTESLTEMVIRAKRIFFAAVTMLTTPFVLLAMGGAPVRDMVFSIAAGVVVVAAGVMFTLQSFRLFREQKISFLVWILYLCAVEISPIGFILLLVAKNV